MSPNKFFAIVLTLLLAACGPESEKQTVLHVGVSSDYPPFEFTKNGEIVGFDIDTMKAIAEEINHKVEFHDMAFDTLIAALQSGRIDAAVSSITITEERAKRVDFSEIYYQTTLAILSNASHPRTNLDELANTVVGAQTGSLMESYLKTKADALKIQIFSIANNGLLVEGLRLGRIDAVLLEASQAREFSILNPDMKYYELEPMDDGYAIAFRKGSPLRDEVNKALHKLEKDGKLEQIRHKWLK